jgi:hypothetical protein
VGAATRLWTSAQGPHDGTARSIEGRPRQDRPSCEALKNVHHQHRGPFAGAARRRDDGSMLGEAASLAGAEVGVPGYDPASRRSVEDLSNPIRRQRQAASQPVSHPPFFVCPSCPRCRSLGVTYLKSLRIVLRLSRRVVCRSRSRRSSEAGHSPETRSRDQAIRHRRCDPMDS